MKSIAALLLTIALALFPLSGSSAMAAVGTHMHATVGSDAYHDQTAAPRHGQLDGHAAAADERVPAAMADNGQQDASKNPCGGDHASSSCCSLSCHAMAPLVGVGVPARKRVPALVSPVALPLPGGVGFDGLLRPPRQA